MLKRYISPLQLFLSFLIFFSSFRLFQSSEQKSILLYILIFFFVVSSSCIIIFAKTNKETAQYIYVILLLFLLTTIFYVGDINGNSQRAIAFFISPLISLSISRLSVTFIMNITLFSITIGSMYVERTLIITELIGVLTAIVIISAFGTSYRQAKQLNEHISTLLYMDSLTGLPNRTKYADILMATIRTATPFTIVALNIDRFKEINRMYGEVIGNELLKKVATRLQETLPSSSLFRVSGDEFHFLFTNYTAEKQEEQAAQLIDIFQKPFQIMDYSLCISASIACVHIKEQVDNLETLLNYVNVTMLAAKEKGPSSTIVFQQEIQQKIKRNQLISTEKERALKENQFSLLFQPIVDLNTKDVISVEALVRWTHPTMGVVFPDEFISPFEKSRFIIPFGNWVLRGACEQAKQWHEIGLPIRISVNISPVQFLSASFVQDVQQIFNETEFPPGYATFEITEQTAVEDVNRTIKIMNSLQSIGIQLSLDDFGTGYSSLNTLQQFPIQQLKIAREFIVNSTNENLLVFIRSICAISHQLSILTVMEGVETDDQLQLLQQTPLHYGQGYLFSKPLSNEQFLQFLQKHYSM